MTRDPVTILLVDDDEDSYVVTAHLLSTIPGRDYRVDWTATYDEALARIRSEQHDLYLIDYRLDQHDGLTLLREANALAPRTTVIMLTGLRDRAVDVEAMEAGAADYLVKDRLDAATLERAIRYALERRRLQIALEDRAARLRALAGQLSEAEQRERSRVARLLHDHLQQILVSAKMHVASLTPEALGQQQPQVQELLDQVMDISRRLTVELSPPILQDAGLAPALTWLARWTHRQYGVHVDAQIDPDAEPEAQGVRLMLFHATRELLLNVIKHAEVDEATLSLAKDGELVCVTVADDGKGFDIQSLEEPGSDVSAFGLAHIRERLELVGGRMSLRSAAGRGCEVRLWAPRHPLDTAAESSAIESLPGGDAGNPRSA